MKAHPASAGYGIGNPAYWRGPSGGFGVCFVCLDYRTLADFSV